jgi:hypothetical protein
MCDNCQEILEIYFMQMTEPYQLDIRCSHPCAYIIVYMCIHYCLHVKISLKMNLDFCFRSFLKLQTPVHKNQFCWSRKKILKIERFSKKKKTQEFSAFQWIEWMKSFRNSMLWIQFIVARTFDMLYKMTNRFVGVRVWILNSLLNCDSCH